MTAAGRNGDAAGGNRDAAGSDRDAARDGGGDDRLRAGGAGAGGDCRRSEGREGSGAIRAARLSGGRSGGLRNG